MNPPTSPRTRLAELTGALALATDAGAALAPETSLRTCAIALGIARALGAPDAESHDVFYASLLRHVGCTSVAHEESRVAGDEFELSRAMRPLDRWTPAATIPALVRGVAVERSPLRRAIAVTRVVALAPSVAPVTFRGRCEVAVRMASRLALGPGVERALGEAFERWDGRGLPDGLAGDAISRPARIVAVAELAALFLAAGGVDAAREVVAARAGGQVDGAVAAVLLKHAAPILESARSPGLWTRVMDLEPEPRATLAHGELGAWAELAADYADLKSPFTLGHSREVARIAVEAARELGFDAESLEELRLAALLHDVGRVTVSNAVWDKPGPLDAGERDLIERHAFESERIVARVPALRAVARVASLAHERLDGSGYHRGLGEAALVPAARLLAAADVAQALSQARAHRPALPRADAAAVLREGVRRGTLCPRAVDAIASAAGLAPAPASAPATAPASAPAPAPASATAPATARAAPTPVTAATVARTALPCGLTEREVEVLRMVATGRTDKEIARALSISHRTVHHHNRHAFAKIGVTTRAATALFMIEHGLLGG
ncbi:MAG: HD domain-containing phosphohydrolase [Burkholderiaceae bacterium]